MKIRSTSTVLNWMQNGSAYIMTFRLSIDRSKGQWMSDRHTVMSNWSQTSILSSTWKTLICTRFYGYQGPFHDLPSSGANLSAKTILFTKNIVIACACKAPEHILWPPSEESSPKQQKENYSGTRNSCVTTKTAQKLRLNCRRENKWEACQNVWRLRWPIFCQGKFYQGCAVQRSK